MLGTDGPLIGKNWGLGSSAGLDDGSRTTTGKSAIADQMANAMMVRGFTSPNEHRVHWHQLRLKKRDWIALASLVVFWEHGCCGEMRHE